MTIENHDLHHEFPEFDEKIHQLKVSDRHFRKLFDAYDDLTKSIRNMENEVTPVTTEVEENAKVERLKLKDELYNILASA